MNYCLTRSKRSLVRIIILLLTFGAAVGFQDVKEMEMDWSRPESIDPLSSKSTSFLDTDLGFYDQKAAVAFNQRRYLDAARFYLYILRHKYDDPITLYNLARCYALLEKPDMAARMLTRAAKAGYVNYLRYKKDGAFQKVRQKKSMKRAARELENRSEALGKTVYIKASKLVKCRVKLPAKYKAGKSYPLLIGLHGNGGCADDFITLYQFFDNQDFIFAAPEGPYPKYPRYLGTSGEQFSWEILVPDEELWRRGDPLSVEYIQSVVEEITRLYSINDVYLMGFSQGAAYSYITGIKHPDVFKGIICLSGRFPATEKSYSLISEEDIAESKILKVFMAHGTKDSLADYKHTVQAKAKLESYGYDVTYHQFDGGHTITPSVVNEIEHWMRETTATNSDSTHTPPQEKELSSYEEIRKKLGELYQDKKYREAETLLESVMEEFPDKIQANSYNLALMRVHLKKYDQAVSALQSSLMKGQWFGKYAFNNEIWAPLKKTESFHEFEVENQRFMEIAQKEAKPDLMVVTPEQYTGKKKYPLFIALHGGNSNIAEFKEAWISDKMKKEFIVAYPQSSQLISMGGYSWTEDIQLAKQEISDAFHTILENYPIRKDEVLIGGFSSGGVAALEIVMEQIIPVSGFIALCPARSGAFTEENIRKAKKRGVRGTILTTEMDPRLADQKEMADIIKKEGLSCEFIITPNIGHWFPSDLDERIDRAIDHIQNN
jgi:predicted esterase